MNNSSLFCIALKLFSVYSRNGTRMALSDWSTGPFVKVLGKQSTMTSSCVETEKEKQGCASHTNNIFKATGEFNLKCRYLAGYVGVPSPSLCSKGVACLFPHSHSLAGSHDRATPRWESAARQESGHSNNKETSELLRPKWGIHIK